MTRNPARTFALVNLAVFALAVAVLLWLRQSGQWGATERETLRPPIGSVETPSDSASKDSASADPISIDDVQPASAAQVDFLNEVLVDVPDGVQEAFSIRSDRHGEERYYVAAPIAVQADTAVPDSLQVAVWRMRGPRDRPTTIAAANEVAVQRSITKRVPSADEFGHAEEAAIDALLHRIQSRK